MTLLKSFCDVKAKQVMYINVGSVGLGSEESSPLWSWSRYICKGYVKNTSATFQVKRLERYVHAVLVLNAWLDCRLDMSGPH